MRKALLALLLAGFAALLWWILQMGPEESADPGMGPAPDAVAGPAAAELGEFALPVDRPGPAAAPAFDNRAVKVGMGRHGLAGLVVDEAGAPVPGAWVAAYSAPFPLFDFEADISEIFDKPLDLSLEPLASVFADERGEFELRGVPGRSLYVTARTRQRLTPRRQRVLPAQLNKAEGVILRTLAGASLSGQVVNAEGQPAAGAEVFVGPGIKYVIAAFRNRSFFLERVYTGADGSFDVEAVPAGATLTVNGFAGPVQSGLAEFGPLPAGTHGQVQLRLDKLGGLSGKVQDPDDEPVSGAIVAAVPLDLRRVIPFVRDPEGWSAATNASGEYRFAELPEGLYLILAQGREGRSAPLTARVSSRRSLAPPLVVNTALSLKGRVVDAEGKPVPDALVMLQSIPTGVLDERSDREAFNQPGGLIIQAAREILPEVLPERTFDRTDARGGFSLPAWTNARLRVTAPGYVQADFKLSGLKEGSQPVLQIHQPGKVEGVVIDAAAKKPVSFYLVRGNHREGGQDDGGASSAGSGGILSLEPVLEEVPEQQTQTGPASGPEWLGEDEQLFRASSSWRAQLGAATLVDDDRGRFQMEGLAPGTWTLTVQADGYENGEVSNVQVASGKVTRGVVISLGHGATVSGKVVSEVDGQPVPGATVTVGRGEESGFLAMLQGLGDSVAMGETQEDGSFRVRGIPARSDYVNVMVDGFASASEKIPELQEFEERTGVEVRLKLGGTLTGLVTDRNGIPLPGRMVGAMSIQARDFQQTAADAKGYYRMEHLRAGSYFLVTADLADESVFAADFATMLSSSRILTAYVADGQVTTVDIVDESAGGCRVSGQLLDRGQPVAGANIVVFATERTGMLDFRFSTSRSDENGEFVFKSLAPGEYRAQIDTGKWDGSLILDVADAPEDYIVLEIPQSRVEGRVVEELTGAPVPNASVQLVSEEDPTGFAAMFGGNANRKWSSSGEDGRFSFEGVSPGRYRIEVTGQRRWGGDSQQPQNPLGSVETESFTLGVNEIKNVDLVRLPVGGTIRVRVVDGQGEQFKSWFSATAKREGEPDASEPDRSRGWGQRGEGYITGLEEGVYEVTVTAREYGTVTQEGVQVRAGQTVDVTVTMVRGVPLRLRVLDAQNRPVATQKVELVDSRGKVVNQDGGMAALARLFGGGGEQELGSYPPGLYTLRVTAADLTQEQSVTLNEGDSPVVEFRF